MILNTFVMNQNLVHFRSIYKIFKNCSDNYTKKNKSYLIDFK